MLGLIGVVRGLPELIPRPNGISETTGFWILTQESAIGFDSLIGGAQSFATEAHDLIYAHTGLDLKVVAGLPSSGIYIAGGAVEGESYSITCDDHVATVSGRVADGWFNGMQTLLQVIRVRSSDGKVPGISIVNDAPRFSWRGLMIDTSRHFFTLQELKKFVVAMSQFKLNTIHVHLSDCQGWRIESKVYPNLTAFGSTRSGSPLPWDASKGDQAQYGPYFYTQAEMRDFVAFAKTYHVRVVPEIDCPGHSDAAIASYPWLSCSGQQIPVASSWQCRYPVCPGKDTTIEFYERLFSELLDIFGSQPFFHLGGDEVDKTAWKSCPYCQARMTAEHLSTVEQLQSWFIQQLAKYLDDKGYRAIGWDEILEGGLPEQAAVMSWRGVSGGQAAAQAGHEVVMSPSSHVYLDFPQFPAGAFWDSSYDDSYHSLYHVYGFDPQAGLDADHRRFVIGFQGNMWSERSWGDEDVEYKIFPRILAVAEVGWTDSESLSWPGFLSALTRSGLDVLRDSGVGSAGASSRKLVWIRGMFSANGWLQMEWTVPGIFGKAGEYQLAFVGVSGSSGIQFRNVRVTFDGATVASDSHVSHATTEGTGTDIVYVLKTSASGVGKEVILYAEGKADVSGDTGGEIVIYATG